MCINQCKAGSSSISFSEGVDVCTSSFSSLEMHNFAWHHLFIYIQKCIAYTQIHTYYILNSAVADGVNFQLFFVEMNLP